MTKDSQFTRRRMLQITGSAAVVGLAGCSSSSSNKESSSSDTSGGGHNDSHSDGNGGHSEAIGAPSDTAEVSMVTKDGGYHFEPHIVRVNVGGTVTWTLESGSHSTAAYHPDNDQPQLVPDGAAGWSSGTLSEAGATFEHTFETEGVYHYYCSPHESLGMLGSVIVGQPDSQKQVALEEPPADKPEKVRKKLSKLNEKIRAALNENK